MKELNDKRIAGLLANLAKGKLRDKIPQLVEALEDEVSEHHRFLVPMHLEHMGYLKEAAA